MFVSKLILAVAAMVVILPGNQLTAEANKFPNPVADGHNIEGEWKVIAHDTLGRSASKEFLAQDFRWDIDKDSLTMRDKSGVSRKGTFKLDSTRDPKSLDITLEAGLSPGGGARVPEKEFLSCIYSLDGDTLKVCYGYSKERPTAFESKEKPGTGLVILRRNAVIKDKPNKD